MEIVKLADSDLMVPQLCIGCWQFNNNKSDDVTWPPQLDQTSQDIVDKALELGLNFFDTAEAYNNHLSEEVLGRAVNTRRRDCVIATKFGATKANDAAYEAPDIEASLMKSLTALQTDYVDIYQVHWSHYMSNVKETAKELIRQQSLGRIKYYAVANFGPKALQEFIDAGGKPITNQVPYNLLWRAVEHEVVPSCDRHNVDILAYSPLQQGLLTGKFNCADDVPAGRRRTRHFKTGCTARTKHGEEGCEDKTFEAVDKLRKICDEAKISMPQGALSWLIAQPRVKSVIAGASSPQQVEQNFKLVKLSQETLNKMNEATEEVKEYLGNNCDEWRPKERTRYR